MTNSKTTVDSTRARSPFQLPWSWVIATVVVCGVRPAPSRCAEQCPIRLRDVTASSGVEFRHTDGSSGRRWVIEPMTAGLATFDYDGDGDLDIYFLNGAPLRGAVFRNPPTNRLYRNDGHFRFTDVTEQAGVGHTGYGLGVAAADYDNDGDQDLYISNFGPNVLYRNNGDGTFTDVTQKAGVATGNGIPAESKVGAGVCFLDADRDGWLDIYCSNYMRFTYADNRVPVVDGIPRYAGPKDFDPEADILFHNNGDGTFTDVSERCGIGRHKGTGMGIIALDYDDDGDTDVAVMNDVRGNFFFENDGTGRFEEVGLMAGVAYNIDGMELASMGVDAADYDNDGQIDLFQTSYSNELPALFRYIGDGFFEDVTRTSGAGMGTYQHVNWGPAFGDFDNDGDRDLFIACGHLQDNVHLFDDTTSYHVRNILLMNVGGGKFVNVSEQCGDGLLPKLSSRGAAVDDLDNDGRLDIVVLNSRREATVIRNVSETGNHWIQIRLHGTRCNRDGVGSRVEVVAGNLRQVDEVHSGRGYQSHFGSRLHFGLGKHTRVDRITVRWLGGGTDVLEDVPVDRLLTIEQGSSPGQ